MIRAQQRRKAAGAFAQLQDLQKEVKSSSDEEPTKQSTVLIIGIRETTQSTTLVMNSDDESISQNGTSTDDSVGSLVSLTNEIVQKVQANVEELNDTKREVQGPEEQIIGLKRKPQSMDPREKTRRRRNPEGRKRRTPLVSFTEEQNPVTNVDTLEAARGEISELRKGLQATLQ